MTAPAIPNTTGKLGPGVLKIGATGTEIDISCLVNNASIDPSKSATDPTTKLCGAVRAGSVSYTYQLTGNIDVDAGTDAGIFALSWVSKGTVQDFTFTPSTELGTTAAGKLVIDPLRFGAGAYGDDLTADIAFDLVGDPAFTYPAGP